MKQGKPLSVTSLIIAAALLGGCITQPKLTPEEQAQRKALIDAYIAQMKAKADQLNNEQSQLNSSVQESEKTQNSLASSPPKEVETVGEAALSEQLNNSVSAGAVFETSRDGIKINGRSFFDPEGEILSYGADNISGKFSYIVKTGAKTAVIKTASADNLDAPVTIANADYERGSFNVKTVTGKSLRGQDVMPTSRGFAVSRNGSIFVYAVGQQGITSYTPPDGFHVARFQRGDIATTGYVLIEKDPHKKGSVQELMDFSTMGNIMGLSSSSDYFLAHVETGKTIPIVMTMGGKEAGFYSQCYQTKYKGINNCAQASFKNSLFRQDGKPNTGHYYWRVGWYNTPEGPYMVAWEHGGRKINIVNLETSESVVAFERGLGITSHSVVQDRNGDLEVNAWWMFSKKTIPNAVSFWKENEKVLVGSIN